MSTPKVAPPPPRRLVAPPAPIQAPDNLTQANEGVVALQDMNFKVAPRFHTLFKGEAVMRGMSMKELLEAALKCYLDTHGSKLDPDRRML
jgi:hypothetical protein